MRAYVVKYGRKYLGFGFGTTSLVKAEFYPTMSKAKKEGMLNGARIIAVDIKIAKKQCVNV